MNDKTFKIVNGDISDGYHTFDELYEHRIRLFITLCKKIQKHRYYGDARNRFGDEMAVDGRTMTDKLPLLEDVEKLLREIGDELKSVEVLNEK